MLPSLNIQHDWKNQILWAEDLLSVQTPYVLSSVLAAAADRVTALGVATAFATTRVIPANKLKVGDIIEVQASCKHVAQNGADTQALALKLGSSQIAASAAMSLAANGGQIVAARIVVSAIGASGVLCVLGHGGSTNGAGTSADAGAGNVLTVDTTAAITFTVEATHSANSAGNQSDLRQFDVRIHSFGGVGVDAAVTMEEVNSLGLRGWKMNTNGDRVRRLYALPDINTSYPLLVRPLWTTGSSTAADTVDWKISVKVQTLEDALAVSAPTTVTSSDTATGTAYELLAGPAEQFAAGVVDRRDIFVVEVEMDAKAVGLTEDIFLLGVEFLYIPVTVLGLGLSAPALPTGWTD